MDTTATMQRHELEAWLGDALADLTAAQVDRLHQVANRLTERYPDPDDGDAWAAAMTAATQYVLGVTTADDVARRLVEARAAQRCAVAAAKEIALLVHEDGMDEKASAARLGVDRMTLRAYAGKR